MLIQFTFSFDAGRIYTEYLYHDAVNANGAQLLFTTHDAMLLDQWISPFAM